MITYNAKDLIQQATMLADLQNSNFISWKENIMFIDNAWTELYQSLIDHGDKTFLQEFSFSGERTFLPDDFYQLYYVCYSDGQYERPINRKAKTSTGQGPYYDIVNNELIIYRDSINSLNNIIVRYYPVKCSIMYRADTVDLNSKRDAITTGAISDVCDKYVLGSTAIYDFINGSSVRTVTGTNNILCIKDGQPTAFAFNNSYISIKTDNKFYTASISGNTLSIKKNNTAVIATYSVAASNFNAVPKQEICTLVDDVIYYYSSGKLKAWNLVTDNISDYAEGLISTKVVSFDGSIYYETAEGIFRNTDLVISNREYDTYNGTMKSDLQSGYGILTDNRFLFGSFEDTYLDFPSNFYYNYLAYRLAIYYKIKQNADVSALMLMLGNAEKTFYDTLPRDENNFVRISNSYAY